jgi:hypothetical protein
MVSLTMSVSIAAGKPAGQRFLQQQDNNRQARADVQWLCSQDLELVQQGDVMLPMQDLCALAYALPGFADVLGGHNSVLPLARATARHAAARIQRGGRLHTPPIMRSWCDLLYGLTKAGLVVNTDFNASLSAVKEHSPDLQFLLHQGAQQVLALLEKDGAVAQDVSLTLLAFAYAGDTGDLGPVTRALASDLEGCLQRAAPQGIANILWALGKLCSMQQGMHQQPGVQPGAYNREVFSYLVTQLSRHVQASHPQLDTQAISNAVYGCALAGHTEGIPQLLDAICQRPELMERAAPQHWANSVWAAATMLKSAVNAGDTQLADDFRGYGHTLLSACATTPGALRGATPQLLSNLLWAASVLGWYDQHFFSDAAAALVAGTSGGMDMKPQDFHQTLLGCAVCAHWDSHVHQLLVSVLQGHLPDFSEQQLAITLYAWAVLTCIAWKAGAGQQQVQELGQVAGALFGEAARRWEQNHAVFIEPNLRQLFQAHMYAEHLGLPQRLKGELLEDARDAWLARSKTTSRSQPEVNSTLTQMGYRTQVKAASAGGLFRPGITITSLPDGTACSIPVEYYGAFDYVAEQTGRGSVVDRLDGPTRLHRVLLAARYPDGQLCINWREWVEATKAGQRQEYLRKALADPLSMKVTGQSDAFIWSGPSTGAQHTPPQAQPSGDQGSTSDACQGLHPSSMPAAADRSHGFISDDIKADLRHLVQALQGTDEQLPDKR